MPRRIVLLAVAAAAAALLVGCGGSPQVQVDLTGGTIVGTLSTGRQVDSYSIALDGQPLSRRPGPDGSFRIPGVDAGHHTLCLTAPDGMQGVYVSVTVADGEESDVGVIEPRPGGRITGTVVKRLDSGATVPAPDVQVVATPSHIWPAIDARAVSPEEPVIVAFTDADGVYDMRAVPPGPYVVSVSEPGYRARARYVFVESWHTSAADFLLVPIPPDGVGTVEGTVYGMQSGGAIPLEGARVTITPDVPWEPIIMAEDLQDVANAIGVMPDIWPPPERRHFSTLTDQDGHYSLNVPSGPALMAVFAEGYWPERREIRVSLHETIVENFRLQPAPDIPPPPVPLTP